MTRLALFIAALLLSFCATSTRAQESANAVVAARVSGQPITRDDVERQLKVALKDRPATPQAQPLLEAQALALLVDRRLVEAYLARIGEGLPPSAVAAAVDKVKADLKAQGSTLEAFLKQAGLSEAGWRRELSWQLNWEKYAAREVTDGALEAYFNAHRREFDGTQLRVSHVLLRAADPAAVKATVAQAEDLRRRITTGELTFAAAAEKYSVGASKQNGGDLGFIPRHGRMDEVFSAAAFRLNKGQTSPPVVTPFGVHLIQVTEIKPGERTWTAVRESLRLAVAQQLFGQLANQERPTAKIEFTGATPYFKSGTQELVQAQK